MFTLRSGSSKNSKCIRYSVCELFDDLGGTLPPDATAECPAGSDYHGSHEAEMSESVGWQISAKCYSFSAVSAPIFARKYAFCSIFQNLPDSQADFF